MCIVSHRSFYRCRKRCNNIFIWWHINKVHRKVAGNGLFGFRFRFHFQFRCATCVQCTLYTVYGMHFGWCVAIFLCICDIFRFVFAVSVCYHQCCCPIPMPMFASGFQLSCSRYALVFQRFIFCLPFMRFKTKFYCIFLGFGQRSFRTVTKYAIVCS